MTRGQRLFVILNSFFIAFLLLAELTGSKLFQVDVSSWPLFPALGISVFTMTLGVIPFPVTFLITDLLNEYYGRRGVRFTTLIGMIAVLLVYGVILIQLAIPAASFSPVSDSAFEAVFASSGVIILASIVAYLIGQLIDIQVFHYLRRRTNGRHIWLRATGSTVVSQLVDSFVVIFIAFGSPLARQPLPMGQVASIAATNFVYKLLVALAITPLIYLGHRWMDRYLGKEAEHLQNKAQRDEAFPITPYPG